MEKPIHKLETYHLLAYKKIHTLSKEIRKGTKLSFSEIPEERQKQIITDYLDLLISYKTIGMKVMLCRIVNYLLFNTSLLLIELEDELEKRKIYYDGSVLRSLKSKDVPWICDLKNYVEVLPDGSLITKKDITVSDKVICKPVFNTVQAADIFLRTSVANMILLKCSEKLATESMHSWRNEYYYWDTTFHTCLKMTKKPNDEYEAPPFPSPKILHKTFIALHKQLGDGFTTFFPSIEKINEIFRNIL